MSNPVSSADGAPAAVLHRLVLEAEPSPNTLLRLLEPFVIHNVLPHRIECTAGGDVLAVTLEFSAPADLAARLHGRLKAMVGVRDACLAPVATSIGRAA